MEKKQKKLWKIVGIFFGISFLFFLFSLRIQLDNLDDIWLFHMAQKIKEGYMPYKEINMIITPLFYEIEALFLKLFGNHYISFHLCGALIIGTILTVVYQILKKITKQRGMIVLGMGLLLNCFYIICMPNYNILVLLFPLLLILLEWKREKIKSEKEERRLDILIGILMALAFFSKQTIGLVFDFTYFVYLLLYDKIKFQGINWKSIVRKVGSAVIVVLGYVLYLVLQGSLLDFLDLCFGGILDFGEKNSSGSFFTWHTAVTIVAGIVSILIFVAEKKDTKALLLGLFSLCSCFIIVPLANEWHQFLMFTIPVITYIFIFEWFSQKIEQQKIKVKLETLSYLIGIGLLCYLVFEWSSISSNINMIRLPEELKVYTGLNLSEEDCDKIVKIMNYIQEQEAKGYEVYILSPTASIYMIPMNRNGNNKLDLLLQGNLGYQGEERVLKEIQKIENPLFLKEEELKFQESIVVDKYIKENYQMIGELEAFKIYTAK